MTIWKNRIRCGIIRAMLRWIKDIKINTNPTVITLAIFVTGFLLFSDTFPAWADQRSELQDKLGKIQAQINQYQQQIGQTKKQSATLKNEVSIYENQIASVELQIQANRTQTDDTNLQIQELQTQIERRTAEIEQNKGILAQLVKQLSQMEDNSFLNIGLGSESFSAFLDQVQYARNVQNQVYALVVKIKEIKVKLEVQQEELKTNLAQLEQLREGLSQSQDALASQRLAKAKLLNQTKGLEKNYQALLAKSKVEEDKLMQEINDLDAAARARVGDKSISAKKGVLAWPMDGILTQGYGNTGFRSLGYNFHNGIDLAAPAGKPIYAAANGTVANCGSGQAAYGNWCAIKHSVETNDGLRNIVTLYAHMMSVKISAGQAVKQGDLIGYEGNTGNTTRLLYGPDRGFHLHFTVFDADGYTVTPGKYTNIYGPYAVPSGVTYNPMNFLGSK